MAYSGHIGGLVAVLLFASVIATVVNAEINLSSFSIKSVESLCDETDYKDVCRRTLEKVEKTSSPKEFIRVAFQTALEEVDKGREFSRNVSLAAKDEFNKNAFKDCEKLLEDAAEELQAALITSHDIPSLAQRKEDIKIWLSAVIAYQQTCIDGVTQPDLKEKLKTGLRIVAKVTSNAIAIVDAIENLAKAFDINMDFKGGRRLMSDDGNFPTWFSVNDRKLLQAHAGGSVKPDAVVAKDGSGDFKTINEALAAVPKKRTERYIIHVKAGHYVEKVLVDKKTPLIFMYGDGPKETIVTGRLNFADGVGTMQTATFSVEGQGFIAKAMGFSNTAGPVKHQAVALRVQADMAAFFNCRMDGYQDTLYAHAHRQFYRNCVVSGTVDFIFGDSTTLLQNCLIIVRRPLEGQQTTVTANGNSESKSLSGLVLHNCRIVPEQLLSPDRLKFRNYLGRPWKAYAKTIIMECTIGDLIHPDGWLPWKGENFEKTCYYAEYNNRGPGAGTSARVKWPGFHVISKETAQKYTTEKFLTAREWLQYTGITYTSGLRY